MEVTAKKESVVEITGVTIELDYEQAADLWHLVGAIGGAPDGTLRETSDPLYHQLSKALGLNWNSDLERRNRRIAGLNLNARPW